jgi:prefoldin subunit 4
MATALAKNATYDEDVHISYEDQSKINKFAINNSKLHDVKDEIVLKKKELQNLNDAIDELVLLDDSTSVPFLYGEVFAHLTLENANEELEKHKQKLENELSELENKQASIKKVLEDLKVYLYGKFGKKINLEDNEED